jgi:hypothetical protein
MNFSKQWRLENAGKTVGMQQTDIARQIGAAWKELTQEEKASYRPGESTSKPSAAKRKAHDDGDSSNDDSEAPVTRSKKPQAATGSGSRKGKGKKSGRGGGGRGDDSDEDEDEDDEEDDFDVSEAEADAGADLFSDEDLIDGAKDADADADDDDDDNDAFANKRTQKKKKTATAYSSKEPAKVPPALGLFPTGVPRGVTERAPVETLKQSSATQRRPGSKYHSSSASVVSASSSIARSQIAESAPLSAHAPRSLPALLPHPPPPTELRKLGGRTEEKNGFRRFFTDAKNYQRLKEVYPELTVDERACKAVGLWMALSDEQRRPYCRD